MREINECRKDIDEIDDEIAVLLAKRMVLSKEIGKIKKKEGKHIGDETREDEIVTRIAEGKEEGRAIAEIYQTIFKVSRELQE